MNLILVTPASRFDRIEFNPKVEYESQVHIGTYTCPNCTDVIAFSTRDFQRHFQSNHSNLDAAAQSEFDRFRPVDTKNGECFLDFCCAGCNSPVRVVYDSWEFAMGCYAFTLKDVVEAVRR